MTAIAIHDLRYTYPDGTEVLAGVDLTIGVGERVALLGPNGAGKTTLALHLNGILESSAGSVEIAGSAVTPETVWEARRRVGLVFQDPDDQLFMTTVRQDVAFGPANYGLKGSELDDRVQVALEAVGLATAADKAPHHLSVGEKRRIALATVLAMEPEILVLDEPSANLDPASREELAGHLANLDATIVMITHDLPYANEVCDRAVIMDAGRVHAEGPTSTILANAGLLARHRLVLPAGFRVSPNG